MSLALFTSACGGSEGTANNAPIIQCHNVSDCPDVDKYQCIDGQCVEQSMVDAGNEPLEGCNPGCDNGFECDMEKHQCICPVGRLECNVGGTNKCLNAYENEDHCGECNNRCADKGESLVCRSGSCVCPNENEGVCPDGTCIPVKEDDKNCGACGNVCDASQKCSDGICACQNESEQSCGSYCANTQNNIENCGQCGNKCASGQICDSGKCQCPTEGMELCETGCMDVQSNADNCGQCGNKCREDQVCQEGQCACPLGSENCNGQCVVLANNNDHCGACNNACNLDEKCNASGTCECDSSRGFIQCAGKCVDKNTDFFNCGGCGEQCKLNGYCRSGECDEDCPLGDQLCKGQCVNFSSLHIQNCDGDRIVCKSNFGKTKYMDLDGSVSNGCEANVIESFSIINPSNPSDSTFGTVNFVPLNMGAIYKIQQDSTNGRFKVVDCKGNVVMYIKPKTTNSNVWSRVKFELADWDGNACSGGNMSSGQTTFSINQQTRQCHLYAQSTYGDTSVRERIALNVQPTLPSALEISVVPLSWQQSEELEMLETRLENDGMKHVHIPIGYYGSKTVMFNANMTYNEYLSNGAAACANPRIQWSSTRASGIGSVREEIQQNKETWAYINLSGRRPQTVRQVTLTLKGKDLDYEYNPLAPKDSVVVSIAPFPLVKLDWISSEYPFVSRNEVSVRAFQNFLFMNNIREDGKYLGHDLINDSTYLYWSSTENSWVTCPNCAWETVPVTNISWYGADAYARYMGGRLPEESEWKKMATQFNFSDRQMWVWSHRAVNESDYNAQLMKEYAVTSLSGAYDVKPSRVRGAGSRKSNINGLYDIIGNTWEYVGNLGYRKGCGWKSTNKAECNIQSTDKAHSKDKIYDDNGFRVMLKEQD